MHYLPAGQFFGTTSQTASFDGVILTDTEYTHPEVDWHYHQNAYFTFLLAGQLIEATRRVRYECRPGTLLFHGREEPHYNLKPGGYTRGFHVEINKSWLNRFGFDTDRSPAALDIGDPTVRLLFYRLHRECLFHDMHTRISVEHLLFLVGDHLRWKSARAGSNIPSWVRRAQELLRSRYNDSLTLEGVAAELNIHPVHLSREFARYFRCTFGDYLRTQKVVQAVSLFGDTRRSLTEIAFDSGFADQSHFTRCFKAALVMTPFQYRKVITSSN